MAWMSTGLLQEDQYSVDLLSWKKKHPSAIKRSPLFTHLAVLLCHHFSHYKLCYLVNVCCDTQGMAAGVGVGARGRGMYDTT